MNTIISLNGIETTNFYEFREWTNLNFPVHFHYALEVVFVISGNIAIEKENELYNLKRGDALVIMPFEKHSCITDTDRCSQTFHFQISPALISNWDSCFGGKTFKKPCCCFSQTDIDEIYNTLKTADRNIIKLNYIFYKIMNIFLMDNEFVTYSPPDNICLEALIYIAKNFSNNITLKEVANKLNVSSVYLSRVFTKKIKFKFLECVNSFRLQEAILLLSKTEKSISEICYECGFGSLRQFNRIFVKTMLCTPSEYRKRNVVPH